MTGDSGGAHGVTATAGGSRQAGSRRAENAAIALVSIGVLTGIGWVVGVLLLRTQHVWSRRDRIIGTLVPVAGLALALVCVPLWTAEEVCRYASNGQLICTGGPTKVGDAVFLTALLGPPGFTAAYLARRRAALRDPRPA